MSGNGVVNEVGAMGSSGANGPLSGLRVLALGGMADRPLCRFLATLGAQVRTVALDADGTAAALFVENLRRYIKGETLLNLARPDLGY